jgi:TolB protein
MRLPRTAPPHAAWALVAGLFFFSLALPAFADSPTGKGPVILDINGSKRELYRIAVPRPVGDQTIAAMVGDVIAGDLGISGWFQIVPPAAFLANLALEGMSIVVDDWRNAGAEAVSKARATVVGEGLALEMKLYEMGRGDRPVLERTYKGTRAQARRFAHEWSNEVVRYFTGEDSFFTSRIAFVAPTGPSRKDVFVMDYDGNNVVNLTNNGSRNILPAWSPTGKEIAFTSFLADNPDVWVISSSGGAPRKLSARQGLNNGPAWSPDGGKIALTLSQDRNAEIYVLAADGSILKRLTENPFIDSSPAWSPDGKTIAFVSNRHGSPQIWLTPSTGGDKTRLTKVGNYNQEPTWCPKCARPTIAFTARDTTGNFDCFTIDVQSGALTRLTEGQGSNEHPTWAPNGRAIAVASSRGGIWILSADGKIQRQVYKGEAFSPAWGPSASP